MRPFHRYKIDTLISPLRMYSSQYSDSVPMQMTARTVYLKNISYFTIWSISHDKPSWLIHAGRRSSIRERKGKRWPKECIRIRNKFVYLFKSSIICMPTLSRRTRSTGCWNFCIYFGLYFSGCPGMVVRKLGSNTPSQSCGGTCDRVEEKKNIEEGEKT